MSYKSCNFQVHEYIAKCNEKKNDGVAFPTARLIHEEIQKIDGIPKWAFTTSYRILLAMGFRYSASNRNSPLQVV